MLSSVSFRGFFLFSSSFPPFPVATHLGIKIFITHCHGDHTFGLPGLLCFIGQDRPKSHQPLEVYGPEGLREWLRTAIRYTCSRIVPPYVVHELKDVPYAPCWRRTQSSYRATLSSNDYLNANKLLYAKDDPSSYPYHVENRKSSSLPIDSNFGELPGGRDIYPVFDHPSSARGAPVWEVLGEEGEPRR